MNDAIFCQLNMCRKRMCHAGGEHRACSNGSRPAALLHTYRSENARSVLYCCERIPQNASCSLYNFSHLSPEPALGVVVVAFLLLGCHFIHISGSVRSFHRKRIGRGSSLLVAASCLLVAHTQQAILVLLPKLTNAPTNCTQDA